MALRLMTWNVENLFLPGAGQADQYDKKLAGLADVINAHNPDIVALQEIGDEKALADVIEKLDGSWQYALSKFPDRRGIRVGFIAQRKLHDVLDIIELPRELVPLQVDDEQTFINHMGRGGLAATIKGSGSEVRLVTCHLKSKLLSYPTERFEPRDENERARYGAYALYRRAAEAATIRTYCNNFLDGHGKSRPLVLLGDMNDEPAAATSLILAGPGGSEINNRGERQPDEGDSWRLFNTAPLLPENERRTRVYRGRGEIVDHILVSRALLEKIVPDSVRAPATTLPSVTDNPTSRPLDEISDHSPVIIELNMR